MEPFATGAELITYMQRDAPADASAELAVVGASGAVRDYCGWGILAETAVTFVLDGNGSQFIKVPTLRLTEVTEVRVDSVVLTAGVDYTWSAVGLLERAAGAVWPARFRSVEVDCTHGYDTSPDGVKLVVLSAGARVLSNPELLTSKTVGGISRTWDKGTTAGAIGASLTALELAVIDRYRL